MIIEMILIVAAYLLGSIPTGFLVARLGGVEDIRKHGSGNIGATNVARTLGKRYFLVVFLVDTIKAYLPVYCAITYGCNIIVVLAVAAAVVGGNTCSFFLSFTGGKGVATLLGAVAALEPRLTFITVNVWAVAFLVVKRVGIASCIAIFCMPLASVFMFRHSLACLLFICCMSMWVIYLHRQNIREFIK